MERRVPFGETNTFIEEFFMEHITDNEGLPTQRKLMEIVETNVSSLLGAQLPGNCTAFTDPAGFNYGITDAATAYYNEAALKTLDTRFESSGDLPHLAAGTFSGLYLDMLKALSYGFSAEDANTMTNEDKEAKDQVKSVTTAFTNSGFTFPDPLPPEAPSPISYVMEFITEKFGDVENIPESFNELRNALATYEEIAADSFALHQTAAEARAQIAKAKAAIVSPNAKNGGLQTGASSYYPGYDKLPDVSALISSLSKHDNKITISIHAERASETQSHLVINKQFEVTVSFFFFVHFSIEHQTQSTVDTFISSKSALDIDISYPGVTLVPAEPLAQSPDGKIGWFDQTALREAAQKSGTDATGYQLKGKEFDPEQLFHHDLSRVKAFVVSDTPTITMKFSKADVKKVTSVFHEHKSIGFNLFSLFDIGNSSDYEVRSVESDESAETVTVNFGPAPNGSLPLEKRTAFILGGVVEYPALS
jgi:hypothetical protein